MEVLIIIFVIMTIMSLGALALLFIKNGEYGNNKIIFIAIGMWSIFVSWMNYTSLPSNYLIQGLISIVFVLLALIAIFLKMRNDEKDFIARVIMAISIVGGMSGLLTI